MNFASYEESYWRYRTVLILKFSLGTSILLSLEQNFKLYEYGLTQRCDAWHHCITNISEIGLVFYSMLSMFCIIRVIYNWRCVWLKKKYFQLIVITVKVTVTFTFRRYSQLTSVKHVWTAKNIQSLCVIRDFFFMLIGFETITTFCAPFQSFNTDDISLTALLNTSSWCDHCCIAFC